MLKKHLDNVQREEQMDADVMKSLGIPCFYLKNNNFVPLM